MGCGLTRGRFQQAQKIVKPVVHPMRDMDVTGCPSGRICAGFFCGAQADAKFLGSWLGFTIWVAASGGTRRTLVLFVNGT